MNREDIYRKGSGVSHELGLDAVYNAGFEAGVAFAQAKAKVVEPKPVIGHWKRQRWAAKEKRL